MAEQQIQSGNEQMRYYPYAGMFYAQRGTFWSAGQDSWTRPPTQNPDRFLSLLNVEPVLQGILQRRRGYQLFSSQAPSAPYTLGYSFRSESLGLRSVVWTSTANILALNEDGTTLLNPIFTPAANASEPRMVLSRDFGYFADGKIQDYVKWDGTTNAGNVTNWGINVGNVSPLIVGPNSAGTSTNNTALGTSWTNPGNATSCNAAFATVSLAAHTFSKGLYPHNYSLGGLTGLTITGVQVDLTYTYSAADTNSQVSGQISLSFNGTNTSGTGKRLTGLNGGTATVTYGGPTDLWGNAIITGASLSTSTFGVFVSLVNNDSITRSMGVDCARVTVYTAPSALTVGAPAAGAITLQNGRTYFYAFQNSKTGHTSSLSPASLSTGPLTSNSIPLSNIPTCLDAQVDTVLILATLDGNDQTTLFLVGTVPNGTSTFVDNVPDLTLETQALYQDTDQQGVLHGIANNNVPPLLNFPTKHKGRIYGAIGSILYFSKNLDEVTTANGLITGKWEEAWPTVNQIDVSEFAETIQGLLSDGETLWIATERCIRRLVGDSPANFQKPEIQFNETGVLNQDSWKVVFYEGQPVGTMWLTPDFRIMASDFNTYEDVGTPVQNILNSINSTAVGTVHAAFVSQGPAEYYMLYLPISGSTPDTILVYNLRNKQWVVWSPTDSPTASLFMIDATGAPRWFFASNAGNIYEWKSGIFQDQVLLTPTSYAVTVQTSWLDFGASSLKKALNQILVTTDDPALTVQVDGVVTASEAQFTSPDPVFPATVIVPAPFRENFVPLASAVSYQKYYRFTFVSPASTAQNVLAAYSIEVVPLLRF